MLLYVTRKQIVILFLILFFFSGELFCLTCAWGKDRKLSHDTAIDGALNYLGKQMDRSLEASHGLEKKTSSYRNDKRHLRPCFVNSYVPSKCNFGATEDIAYLYDQALVLLAFLARGNPDDLKRAEMIADAMVLAQTKDRAYSDGRLRNAYAVGFPIDPNTNAARLPGQWNDKTNQFEEDEYAVGSDTGNMAWAALALIQAGQLIPSESKDNYITAALRLANWIVDHTTAKAPLKGFNGGYAGWEKTAGDPSSGPESITWRSTEHNIDLVALFNLLLQNCAKTTSNKCQAHWRRQKDWAAAFVMNMREENGENSYLLTGLESDGKTFNRSFIPVDAQAWSVLAFEPFTKTPSAFQTAFNWALTHCGSKDNPSGYDFNCNDGDGIWWEGTAQVATALYQLKNSRRYQEVAAALLTAQVADGKFKGAVPATSKCGLTTGIYKLWQGQKEAQPLLYSNRYHIGATAWFVFALSGKNPYRLAPY